MKKRNRVRQRGRKKDQALQSRICAKRLRLRRSGGGPVTTVLPHFADIKRATALLIGSMYGNKSNSVPAKPDCEKGSV